MKKKLMWPPIIHSWLQPQRFSDCVKLHNLLDIVFRNLVPKLDPSLTSTTHPHQVTLSKLELG